jgi:hypothetical protein
LATTPSKNWPQKAHKPQKAQKELATKRHKKHKNPAHGSGGIVQVLSINRHRKRRSNPANGSWRIVQVRTIHQQRPIWMNSEDPKYPPTTVSGIILQNRFKCFFVADNAIIISNISRTELDPQLS